MKILALDFGEKRIGIAIGDPEVGVAAARDFLENSSDVFENLIDLIGQDNVEQILIGLPYGLSGGETEQTKSAREFAAELESKTATKIELVDERFTSRIATSNLQAAGENSRKQKSLVDSEAARIMLQEYLDSNL